MKNLQRLVILACLAAGPAASMGEELWTVREGSTTLRLDANVLQDIGLRVRSLGGAQMSDGSEIVLEFPIDPAFGWTFSVGAGGPSDFVAGEARHVGGFVLTTWAGEHSLSNFILYPAADNPFEGFGLADGLHNTGDLLEFSAVKSGFDRRAETLIIVSGEVLISAAWAEQMGIPKLAETVIGSAVTRVRADWIGGDAPAPQPGEASGGGLRGVGPDVSFCQLYGLGQYGRLGDIVGLALATTSWNLGNRDLEWYQSPDSRHPMIVMNLYRNKSDRFEQIGQSWIKHGFFALSNTQCGGSCTFESGHSGGDWLGQGCTDTYSASLNASQGGLGPRYEVNPWTGAWSYTGSHFQTGGGSHNAIEHRLQVHDADLDPAQNAGATYYAEGYYAHFTDTDVMNSASWKPVTVSGVPGGTFTFGMSGSGTFPNIGFAIDAWSGATQTVLAQQVPVVEFVSPDGRCILSAKTTNLGGGVWHYEYALLNIDMDRQVGSFSIPISAGTLVTNVGFHAVEHHNEPINSIGGVAINNNPWTSSVGVNSVSWSTTTNPLRWGTLYNFRFDANQAPITTTVTLGLFKAGSPSQVTGSTFGPMLGPSDCNNNGIDDLIDIASGTSQDCNGNNVPDECETDCNANGVPDDCDIASGTSQDCNGNGIPDDCEPDCDGDGVPDDCEGQPDCNANGLPDDCDIQSGTSSDVNGNAIPDECEGDCNSNGVPDPVDISTGASFDCNTNGVPDECEAGGLKVYDIPVNPPLGIPDGTNQWVGTSFTVSDHGVILDLDVDLVLPHTWNGDVSVRLTHGGVTVVMIDRPGRTTSGFGFDDDGFNIVLDDEGTGGPIENVSNRTGVVSPPSYTPNNPLSAFDNQDKFGVWTIEAKDAVSQDSGSITHWSLHITNESDPIEPCLTDCNQNGIDDAIDISSGTSEDCNGNGVPDECDIADATSADCDSDGVPDECQSIPFVDCNANGQTDYCDIASGVSMDCDGGPVGSSTAGATLFGSSCSSCHGADGSGGVGPDIRDRSRTFLWNKLLPPTDHAGGARPSFTQQDFADLEAFLATLGSRGRPDNVPDECQTLADCNANGIADGCDLESGASVDLDYDGIPDECQVSCTAPVLVWGHSIASHKTGPGATDEFYVDLNITGSPASRTSEPRDSRIRVLEFQFDQDVQSASIAITGPGGPAGGGALTLGAGTNGPMSWGRIDLGSALPNDAVYTLVVSASSGPACDLVHTMCVAGLVGDFDSSGDVTASDKATMTGFIFQAISQTNARFDVQVNGGDSGVIEVADLGAWTGFFGTTVIGDGCP